MSGIEWLLDTNMVIGLLKGHDTAIALAEEQNLVLGRAAVSQISRMELLGFPGLTEDEEGSIETFLNACQVVLLDETIEQHAIRLRRSGMFKLPDAIIAATARTMGLQLLTLDKAMSSAMSKL
ncbi:MAG: type II toxin-antitoxin system VapC family toxin [Magnetococcales bacterium]|nr:type II toxin-antitoxin system VapC family toxin [Magnetococcales bacterium]